MAFTSDDISINTLIGPGSFVSGNIKINGFIRVDGDINGKIETSSNVIIGDKARIKGDINAKSIVIGGIVLGDVTAPKGIKLLSNSIVVGNLITQSLPKVCIVCVCGKCFKRQFFNVKTRCIFQAVII